VLHAEWGAVSAVAHTGSNGQVLRRNQTRNPVEGTAGSDNPGQMEVPTAHHTRSPTLRIADEVVLSAHHPDQMHFDVLRSLHHTQSRRAHTSASH